jgi:hypothetical protein
VLNRLTLGIKNGALGHDPYVCLHEEIIALRREVRRGAPQQEIESGSSG